MDRPIDMLELEIEPIPPDTVSSVKEELIPLMQQILQENRVESLFQTELKVEVEKTFPTDAAIIVGLTFLSGLALETYKGLIIPALKKKFIVKERPKHRKKK